MTYSRVWAKQELRYCPHTSVSGEVGYRVKGGTCTGDGAADGTTIVDTNGDSGGADTYNGRYCVKILSGACKGQVKRVTDDSGAGTLTFEAGGFTAQIVSGVEYEIRTLPDPCVVVDSSSGETNMVDAVRTEADTGGVAFWKGYYACPITGTYKGKVSLITGCVAGTGTFTLAAGFGGALAAGDVVLLRKFVEVANLALPDGPPYHDHPMIHSSFSRGTGTVGARGGTLAFGTQVTGSNSLAAADAGANPSVLSGLFQAAGLEETVLKSVTVDGTNASASAVVIATGDRENLAIGGALVYNGSVSFITSLVDGAGGGDTANVTPDFPSVPTATTGVLCGTRMYAKSQTGSTLGVLVEVEIDGIRQTFVGCKGNVSLADAAPLQLNWSFSVDDWWEENEATPWANVTPYTAAYAIEPSSRKAYLTETGVDIGGFTASPNTKVVGRNFSGAYGVNGRSGYQVTDTSAAGATFREMVSTTGELDAVQRFYSGTQRDLIVVYGTHGNMFAVRIPAAQLKAYPKMTNQDGMMSLPNVVEAGDAGTATNDTTVTKVPDFAFFLS